MKCFKFRSTLIWVLSFFLFTAICSNAQVKLVEDVELRGYRAVTKEEILKNIKSKPGKQFDRKQAEKDFTAVMAMGVFDMKKSKLYIDDGPRGGVVLVFIVEEKQK